MAYFADHYEDLRFPVAEGNGRGFRAAQLGALHSIAGHFSQFTPPAIVTMPTGSGKTAVLVTAAFLLRARRVLVLAPSRLIREQIAEQFKLLSDLVAIGALDPRTPAPRVSVITRRIGTDEEWQSLVDADVVVGLPQSASPAFEGVAPSPVGFFDLVLVDEAHHSPARTWQALLKNLNDARQVLFTSTPFRRDRREITGRFVYTYHMREAYRDGLYGQIHYEPVPAAPGEDADRSIALRAEQILRSDQHAGLDHRIIVRAGTIVRAKALKSLYEAETGLRVALLTGEHSLKYARTVLRKVREGDLDGIVCVDMLGEGIDVPNLKVAALHTPHRSLGIVLQFIGRFARTNAAHLGRAVFIATTSEIEVEEEKLYAEGAVWHEMLPNLAAARVEEEQVVREVLDTFMPVPEPPPEAVDVSMHSIRLFHHVKILSAGNGLEIDKEITFPPGFTVVHRHLSDEYATVVYITRERARPEWALVDGFDLITYDVFLIHYHEPTGFLFICTSRRETKLYQHLSEAYSPEGSRPLRGLSLRRLNRVLVGVDDARFFNIGMRHTTASALNESYRTLAGPSVDQAIRRSDSRAYRRGHWFGSGVQNGRDVTIGLSSASKVWSNTVSKIPQLVAWCDSLALKIAGNADPATMSGLDLLPTAEEVAVLPANIVYVDWNPSTYHEPPRIWYADGGEDQSAQLLDLDLQIELDQTNDHHVGLLLKGDHFEYRAQFSLETATYVTEVASDVEIFIGDGPDGLPLTDYLNEAVPALYTADFGVLEGAEYSARSSAALPAFDAARIETHDWSGAGISIIHEASDPGDGRHSVHWYVEEQLRQSTADVVFYDHGAGEVADFISIDTLDQVTRITLVHCKASGGAQPGHRLDDVYEVCAQVSKSMFWLDRHHIMQAVGHRRAVRPGSSRFVKGSLDSLRALLTPTANRVFVSRMLLVQPGLSRLLVTPQMANVLAAADDFVQNGGCQPLSIWGSP